MKVVVWAGGKTTFLLSQLPSCCSHPLQKPRLTLFPFLFLSVFTFRAFSWRNCKTHMVISCRPFPLSCTYIERKHSCYSILCCVCYTYSMKQQREACRANKLMVGDCFTISAGWVLYLFIFISPMFIFSSLFIMWASAGPYKKQEFQLLLKEAW